VDEEHTLTKEDITRLLDRVEKNRSIFPSDEPFSSFPWVRLVLPLSVKDRLNGVWLLGRRSPDDFYAQSEIPILQTLANQTAIALTNIAQSDQLLAMYQTNIDRYEQERTKLARDLHDEFINRLVVLGMYVDMNTAIPRFTETYRELVEHLRQTVSGLRPPILHYGLEAALEEMVDELSERFNSGANVEIQVKHSGVRYPSNVEEHIYRIVQQATENALRHARAKTIRISGSLELERVELEVVDDGTGFETGGMLEISQLLSDGHFGLVGTLERARLIDATIEIHSTTGSGTRFSIGWSPDRQVNTLID
jgi:signal transduction histidine kinase